MITTQGPTLTADDLWSIVDELWDSMMGRTAVRVDHAFNVDRALTGVVSIDGDWQGHVTFTCPRPAADDVARALLGLRADEAVSADDVTDALGEVTNIVGGHVKSLCAGNNTLGLPQVHAGLATPQAQVCCRTGLEWSGHVARVGVWRSTTSVVGSGDGEGR